MIFFLCPAGDSNWLTVATGVVDCYYNVTDLPPGGAFRFRVTCSNKAGQGPYSNCSGPVSLDSTGILDTVRMKSAAQITGLGLYCWLYHKECAHV